MITSNNNTRDYIYNNSIIRTNRYINHFYQILEEVNNITVYKKGNIMYIDYNHGNVGEIVLLEDNRIGIVINKSSDNNYAYVKTLKFASCPVEFETVKVWYARMAVQPTDHVIRTYGKVRGDNELVEFDHVYYDNDILFWHQGIMIDPEDGEIYDTDDINHMVSTKDPIYCTDGFAIHKTANLRKCANCGKWHFKAKDMFKAFEIYADCIKESEICEGCSSYYNSYYKIHIEEMNFDEPVSSFKDELMSYITEKDELIKIMFHSPIACRIIDGERWVFNMRNYGDDIKECAHCGNYFLPAKKKENPRDLFIEKYLGVKRANPDYCCCCDDYTGKRIESYHYKPEPIMLDSTKHHFGVELETTVNNVDIANACIGKIKIQGIDNPLGYNAYYAKRDGSIPYNGLEIVSHPLTIEQHEETARELFTVLEHFDQEATHDCGMHVHTSRSDWSEDTPDKVYVLLRRFKHFIYEVSGRENPEDMDEWAGINNVIVYKRGGKLRVEVQDNDNRYHALNNCNDYTLEIRIFASTTDYDTYINNIQFVEDLFTYAENHTLDDCVNVMFDDVFPNVDHSRHRHYNFDIEERDNVFRKWLVDEDTILYVDRIDDYSGTYRHYHIVGYPDSCAVRLPVSGRIVRYTNCEDFISISNVRIYPITEPMTEDDMAARNAETILMLDAKGNV